MIEHMSEQPDGRFIITFRDKNNSSRLFSRADCAFCLHGKAEMFDDEYITVVFERVVPIDDMDMVRAQHRV